MEHLDKVFPNEQWLKLFPNASIFHLPKTHSDHNPLLVQLIPKLVYCNKKYFRLEII